MDTSRSLIAIEPLGANWIGRAEKLAFTLCLPMILVSEKPQTPYSLLVAEDGLSLKDNRPPYTLPLRADFASPTLTHRRLKGGGKQQAIAKAIGIKPGYTPSILDATAGLRQDGFILASLGCNVHMLERHKVVASLLADGLERGKQNPELASILARMTLEIAPADAWLVSQKQVFDVIYLDPMFPEKNKSAASKKGMRIFQELVGRDEDADNLLGSALRYARKRVVVKRPSHAPYLAGRKPEAEREGKSCRFDIYSLLPTQTEACTDE